MADKGFGVKELNLIGDSGTPTIISPNNLNLNAVNVAISTDVSIGGTCTATEFSGAISGWILGASGPNHYEFTGPGLNGTVNDPDINLVRGQKYIFHNRAPGHPFRIQSTPNGSVGSAYNTGVTNNDGSSPTDIVFDVPQDAPNLLYYQCTAHTNMGGVLHIGSDLSLPVNTQASTYIIQKTDVGNMIKASGDITVASANELSVGDIVTIYNATGGNINITRSSTNIYLAGDTASSNRVLAQKGIATLVCVDSNEYVLMGGGIT
tara:strand:+ start:280 stop:1071 length:792 start_codon:yes stop_codon:yes gene_type:complete